MYLVYYGNMANPWDNLPAQFLKNLDSIVPEGKIISVLQSFCQIKPPTFRANTLKISPEDLAQELTKRGFKFERVPWLDNGFILKGEQRELTASDIYNEGYLYIQSLSSMIPALVLEPQKDEKILDLTAAPGSKTTQMAAMMENTGEILANDASRVRLYKLAANLKIQGITNTKIAHRNGQKLWQEYPEKFDKALVDVPCSLEGRFLASYPKSYIDWTPKKVRILASLQKFLLRSAISATKPGGVIVYSTCTLEPEENEEVIDWLLKKEGTAIEILDINIDIPGKVSGFSKFAKKSFDPSIEKTVRVLPSETMEGFFIAKIKKNRSTLAT